MLVLLWSRDSDSTLATVRHRTLTAMARSTATEVFCAHAGKQLVEAQGKAQAEQTKAVIDLKDAVQKMDTANQVGLANVVASLSHQTARVDRHEAKLDAHDVAINALDRRLTVVETEK